MWKFPLPFSLIALTAGVAFLGFADVSTNAAKVRSESPLTPKELQDLEKLKRIANNIVTYDYQKEDSYLLKWLRTSSNDVSEAVRRLKKSMAWRKEKDIDGILENPVMKRMAQKLKFTVDAVDKHGHPILDGSLGRWDFRKIILSGNAETFQLYFIYMFETALKRARELSAESGKDISEFVGLFDASGFSVRTHACIACLTIMSRVVMDMENNYPGFIEYFLVSNAPRGFDIMIDFVRPFMSPTTKERLKVFSTSSVEGREFIGRLIDDDQLGSHYGGTRRKQ